MSGIRAVVSLGHDALGVNTQKQKEAVQRTAGALAELLEKDYQLTITHSNGPQVSMIHKAMSELSRINPEYTASPMCVCSAMSQGYVGYDLQNALDSELIRRGVSRSVVTVLTQVKVDPYDEAFYSPEKRIGRVLSAVEADLERGKGNFVEELPEGGYMRVVAAPKPLEIVELDTIRLLADAGRVVIACGGGGIPVLEQSGGLQGASAVIEKDAIAGKLAEGLNADLLIILTREPFAYKDFGDVTAQPIMDMDLETARSYVQEGHFAKGSMLPKIEAAVSYLTVCPKGEALITSLSELRGAIQGKSGTRIHA
ncbi:MAG: carbamate kinase [Lachnospiraceae bacterium]|nr:carbamate kinase [Lachnospiraceae bacterium]